MRCYICDNSLSDNEINFNEDHKRYDPCFTCIDASDTRKFLTLEDELDTLDISQDTIDDADIPA